MACTKYKLSSNIEYCDHDPNGIRRLILVAYEDIESMTKSVTAGEDNIITAVTRKTATKGYEVADGRINNPWGGSGIAHESSDWGSMATKTLQFSIPNNGAVGARDVMSLNNQYVAFALLANNEVEIYGGGVPLTLTDKSKQLTGTDQIGWLITMSTKENNAGLFLFDTDATTTLSSFLALLSAA